MRSPASSPDAIRKGAFDKYAEDNTAKKGTIKVDDAFLQEIENWRTLLARNIALRNLQVANERQLNFAVQKTIDRIIFLRISEDRGIEPQNQLQELGKGKEILPVTGGAVYESRPEIQLRCFTSKPKPAPRPTWTNSPLSWPSMTKSSRKSSRACITLAPMFSRRSGGNPRAGL